MAGATSAGFSPSALRTSVLARGRDHFHPVQLFEFRISVDDQHAATKDGRDLGHEVAPRLLVGFEKNLCRPFSLRMTGTLGSHSAASPLARS